MAPHIPGAHISGVKSGLPLRSKLGTKPGSQLNQLPENWGTNRASTAIWAAWMLLESHFTGKDRIAYRLLAEKANLHPEKAVIADVDHSQNSEIHVNGSDEISVFLSNLESLAIGSYAAIQPGLQDLIQTKSANLMIILQPGHNLARIEASTGKTDEDIADVYGNNERKLDQSNAINSNLSANGVKPNLVNAIKKVSLILRCQTSNDKNPKVELEPHNLDSDRVNRLVNQLNGIAQQLVGGKDTRLEKLSDVNFMTEDDLADIWKWNSILPDKVERCVHELITEQALARPDSPAICAWDGNLSYKELLGASYPLSRQLLARGVKPGTIVPLCFEKSVWAPVAILAVMLTGGAFVLLDYEQPEERLRGIVQQVAIGAPECILASANQTELVQRLGGQAILVDANTCAPGPDETIWKEGLADSGKAENTLYVVFTSGTTGAPKGVCISHANFSTAIEYQAALIGIENGARVFDFAGYAFDVAINNCLMTLAKGGCLCIPSNLERKSAFDIAAAITRSGATMADLTPSVARLLSRSDVPSLKVLNLSGEVMNAADVIHWKSPARDGEKSPSTRSPDTTPPLLTPLRLINSYGPAECTVTCLVNPSLESPAHASIIGRGIGAVSWIVSVDTNRLLPIGAIGQLLIEGPLVGQGYLNLPAQTASAFITAPPWLSQHPDGSRTGRDGPLYCTGDLVRYLPDGSVEYVGRADAQSKINGQRFEPEEVEFQMRRYLPANTQVVVEFIEHNDQRLLVAFVVLQARAGAKEDFLSGVAELRSNLERTLPSFMLPTSYIPVLDIPLNASSKTDRMKLRALGSSMALIDMISAYPVTSQFASKTLLASAAYSNELQLRELWAGVLHIEPACIGLDSHFLALGGESMAAIHLASAARRAGLSLTTADILGNPLFGDMLQSCSATNVADDKIIEPFSLLPDSNLQDKVILEAAKLCKVLPLAVEDLYPPTPLQCGLMALGEKRDAAYVGRQVLELPPKLDINRFKAAWESVAAANAVFRTRIIYSNDAGMLQVVLRDPKIVWQMADSLYEYLEKDNTEAMTLSTPLCRCAIIKSSSAYFVLTMHHAIYDGWTLPRIGNEVFKAYRGDNIQSQLNFNSFIKHIVNQPVEPVHSYWTSQLADSQHCAFFPQLPTVGYQPRADALCLREITLPSQISVVASIPSVVQAAWSILVAKLCDNSDIIYGTIVSGRNVPIQGVENLLSPTFSTVPTRVHLDGLQTMQDFLYSVQQQAVEMMPFENYGLQNIQSIDSSTGEGCKFQTLLVIQPPDIDFEHIPAEEPPETRELRKLLQGLDLGEEVANFNEYALMLTVTLREGILFIEASHDSYVLREARMNRILAQLEHVLHQIFHLESSSTKINHISCTIDDDLEIGQNHQTVEYLKSQFHGARDSAFPAQPSRLESSHFKSHLTKTLESPPSQAESVLVEGQKATNGNDIAVADQPLTPLEREIRELWARVLNRESALLYRSSNFFREGGDSIRAMHLSGLARSGGISLSVSSIFKKPTLSDMSSVAFQSNEINTDVLPFSLIEKEYLEETLEDAAIQCKVPVQTIEDVYPTTPLQQGLVALTMKQPTAYISRSFMRLSPHIDLEKLEAAFREVVRCNPILRTRIIDTSLGLLQVVLKPSKEHTFLMESATSPDETSRFSVDLGSPLNRWRLNSAERLLTWEIHHSLYDDMSLSRIEGQLVDAYFGKKVESEVGFNHFIQYIQSRDKLASLKFWKSELSGAQRSPKFPTLPTKNFTPSPDKTVQHSLAVNLSLNSATTLQATIYAAWAILVSALTGSDGVVFGSILTGRNADVRGIHQITGPTITTVPVVVRVADRSQPTETFVGKVQQQIADMMPFEHTGLHNISKIDKDSSAACQFQTSILIYSHQDVAAADRRGRILAFSEVEDGRLASDFNTYALNLTFSPSKESMALDVDFDTRVLSASQVDRLVGQLERVLHQLVNHTCIPGRVQDVDYMGPKDLQDIWQWNGVVPEPETETITELFAAKTKERPDTSAIIASEMHMTYKELDRASSRLASGLFERGIKRGVIVPLIFEKSGWMTVAMIAVWKAGGAILALDINQPRERIREVMARISAELILATKKSYDLALGLVTKAVLIDSQCIENVGSDVVIPRCARPLLSDICYLVLTSGTTGQSKCVAISHANLSTSIKYQAGQLGFAPNARVLEYSSYNFDVSVSTIAFTLATGGCLCVPTEAERMDDLEGVINRMSITLVDLTPSVVSVINPENVPSLKVLNVGGEAVDTRILAAWISKIQVNNLYGPAECTAASVGNLNLSNPGDNGIGTGLGAVTWVVDPSNHARLSPVGCIGELLLEGPLLGMGYYKDDEANLAAFENDVSWLKCGAIGHLGRTGRLYKTGDLVRYHSNGSLEFIGRKDTQVKLRGQRIELEEIEFQIRNYLDNEFLVTVEVVTSRHGATQMLAAFLSNSSALHEATIVSPTPDLISILPALSRHLNGHLPEYMTPSKYFFVDKMPLGITGKRDRKQLKKLGSLASVNEGITPDFLDVQPRREPTTVQEVTMQRLWGKALVADGNMFGSNDHFFMHGGDSISAMRLVHLVKQEGLSLTVGDVFSNPILADMAKKLTVKYDIQADRVIPAFSLLSSKSDIDTIKCEVAKLCGIEQELVKDVYDCTPLQASMVLATAKRPSAYVSKDIFLLPSDVDIAIFVRAWDFVVSSHPILRTRIVLLDNNMVQVVVKESIDWNHSANLEEYLASDEHKSMALGSRLSRWAIIESPGQKKQFVWTIHHALYDGWTLSVLMREFAHAYHGKPSLDLHYDHRPFLQYLRNQNLDLSKDFWLRELTGTATCSIFPALPNKTYQPLSQSVCERKLKPFPSHMRSSVTLSTMIYAAWSILAARLSGTGETIFGSLLTGRNVPVSGIDRIMGPTITTVPLRVRVESSQLLDDFMVAIQKQMISMIPFEHFGFHQIRRINADCDTACNVQTVLLIQPPSNDAGHEESTILDLMESLDDEDQLIDFNDHALFLQITPGDRAIDVQVTYDDNIVASDQIERLLSQFEVVMQQLCMKMDSQVTVGDVNCLSKTDFEDIWKWNGEIPEAVDDLMHHLVSKIAQEQPDRLAIDAWDGRLTYRDLDVYSTHLAAKLKHGGVQKCSLVPLLFEKSLWTSVSMLAVLKAGAGFVPLDAQHPQGRLRAAMQTIKPQTIISSAKHSDLASTLAGLVIVVDRATMGEEPSITRGLPDLIEDETDPSSIAYAIFTSGTTGSPKCIQITHRNLCTSTTCQSGILGFCQNTRSIDFASYSFDASVSGLFYTLFQRGCLCVPSDDDRRRGNVGAIIDSMGVNLAQLTPSISRTFLPKSVPKLKTLILVGEPLTSSDVSSWIDHLRIINVYGPSECTYICSGNLTISNPLEASNIGRGLGANLWICEAGNPIRLAAVGCVGEILIEGPLLGAGYLGDPEKTVESIVSNPPWLLKGINSIPGRSGKLFRTGDMGRHQADGTIIYVGRREMEIKLRGQRVDLYDVENNVRPLLPKNVQITAEIITPKGESSSPMLVCFVALPGQKNKDGNSNSDSALTNLVAGLDRQLDDYLPTYLKPSAYVSLDKMPMASSGKTDRRFLKAMGSSLFREQMIDASGQKAPEKRKAQTPMEEKLIHLWAHVLGLPVQSIGADDNFRLLGGDSLRAMQLVTTAEREGLVFTMADLFGNLGLSSLARVATFSDINTCDPRIAYTPFSLLEEVDEFRTLICKEAQVQLNVTIEDIADIYPANGFQVDCLRSNIDRFGLQYAYLDLNSNISVNDVYEAFHRTLQAFEVVRGRFIEFHGSYYQVIHRVLPLITAEHETQEELSTFSNRFCAQDPSKASLTDWFTTFTLVKARSNRRRIIVRLSHTQNDGFCLPQIFKAFEDAFHHRPLQNSPPLSLLLHHRSQKRLESHEYWTKLLAGSEITPSLRFNAGPGTLIVRTQAVSGTGLLYGMTVQPQVVLSAAWALVLSDLLGRSDVVFGNVIAGRNSGPPDIHRIVGPCVNVLPMRVKTGAGGKQRPLTEILDDVEVLTNTSSIHEGLDWKDLVQNCTRWAPDSKYGTAVHFRNMEDSPDIDLGTATPHAHHNGDSRVGEHVMKIGWYDNIEDGQWTALIARPEGNELRLEILASPANLDADKADEILGMVVKKIRELITASKRA